VCIHLMEEGHLEWVGGQKTSLVGACYGSLISNVLVRM
jgi:hypothetical protein